MKHKETKPSFFKVLIGDFSKKLKIPPAFVKNLNGSSLGKIILESPSGEYWIVKMEKDANGLWFGGGWQEFVKGHSLEVGDFLVFKYYGNSKFSVKIFGKSSCEKVEVLAKLNNDRPTIRTNNGNQNQARDEIQERKPEECEADHENEAKYSNESTYAYLRSGKKRVMIEVDKPKKRSAVSFKDACYLRSGKKRVMIEVDKPKKRSAVSFKDACKKVVVPVEIRNDHLTFRRKNDNQIQARVRTQECKPENCEDIAIYTGRNPHNSRSGKKRKPPTRSACSFRSENSCFIVTFTDSSKYRLTIARKLAREKNLKAKKIVKLKDPSGRSWQVKLDIRPQDNRVDFKDGWIDFCKGNRLAPNDTLVFEYLQSSVMQVHIFREEGSRQNFRSQMFNAAKAIKIDTE